MPRTPSRVLDGNDVPALAKYMKSESCKNIVVLVRVILTQHPVGNWRSQLGAGKESH